jgi:Retinal pigment epithelial membrane protein
LAISQFSERLVKLSFYSSSPRTFFFKKKSCSNTRTVILGELEMTLTSTTVPIDPSNPSNPAVPASFPKAIMSVSREEFYGQDAAHAPITLTIRDGKTEQETLLPEDLQGHVFIVSPAGSVDSETVAGSPLTALPAADGWSPVLNGDGMVYRLDFHKTPAMELDTVEACQVTVAPGKAWLATRLLKTPCYYVDAALHNQPQNYPNLSRTPFRTWGIARLSIAFGVRNQNNTALVSLKLSDQPERVLVTEDIGRPWEIDPCTLKMVAPVGWNWDWEGVVYNPLWNFRA